ncbi:hypothetical protein N7456_001023 [Penicillium angulare]|uniref:Uncharacterized protein n=1 Tax=Penicillium angulare TaxID=116970 RepID=A0A9W9KSN3_9EURO|nr:hypothetical protein N7456_001023 [Penicillium angulare]
MTPDNALLEQVHTCDGTSTTSHCMRCMNQAIDLEYASRDRFSKMDLRVHHYNFYGNAVYEKSGTPPAESLAIILSRLKQPKPVISSSYLVRSLLNCAKLFLDPVITTLNEDTLKLRGNKLVLAASDNVHKCYSPHGTWTVEDNSGESIATCPEDPEAYMRSFSFIASGFMNSPTIEMESQRVYEEPPSSYPRRRLYDKQGKRIFYSSPLRQCQQS